MTKEDLLDILAEAFMAGAHCITYDIDYEEEVIEQASDYALCKLLEMVEQFGHDEPNDS